MINNLPKDIKFSNYYKKLNIFSFILIVLSIATIFLKGLNLGVDFKGGTLIELRVENSKIRIGDIRQYFYSMGGGGPIINPSDYFTIKYD